jgi:hypothetical protein
MRSAVVVALLTLPILARAEERYYDFRPGGEEAEHADLMTFGPDVDKYLTFEKGGLHIRLPAERAQYKPVGLETYPIIRGDFEITVGYSLLAVGEPKKQYGAGLLIFLRSRFVPYHEAIVGRFRKPKGEVFSANRHDSNAPPPRWQAEPAETRSGYLRLARLNEEIVYQVAGNDGRFREIWRQDFPAKDLGILRISANTGLDHVELDAIIRDLRIRADGIFERDAVPPLQVGAAAKARGPEPAVPQQAIAAEPAAPSHGWRLISVIFLATIAALASIAWLARRRTRSAEPDV